MVDNLVFLIIDILLLVWSITQLNNWMVHPQESAQQIIKAFGRFRKIFFFLTPFSPMNFYERNPEYMIQRYRIGAIIAIVISIIGFVLAIMSMVRGNR